MADNNFPFIVSSGPKVPKDPALRTLIRKQAMKDVGIARKKRGGQGRVNLRKHATESSNAQIQPTALSISERSSTASGSESTPLATDTETDATSADEELVLARPTPPWTSNPSWTMPLNGNPATEYDRLRMKYHFDIQDLSALTSFHIGRSTMLAISTNPELVSTLLGSQMQSYLEFIPARYGHKPYLTAVVDCVSAKMHSKLYPPNAAFAAVVMRLYAKALAYVQEAVAGDESSLDPDLLCAVQMLSLHEILDPDRADAYDHHVNGSALIVKRRTPSSFKTDYEKMLFHAHIGPTFAEAIMKNQRCYLGRPEWMRLYESLIEDTPWLTDRSEMVIRLRMQLLGLCDMLIDTSEAMNPNIYDEGLMLTVELKARQTHQAILKCLDDYKAHLVLTSMAHAPQPELALRREVYGTALECLCIHKRILASFCEEERLALEVEAQSLAADIFELQTRPSPRHSWIYSAHEKGVAVVVQLTKDTWEEDLSHASPQEKRLAACRRWKTFNSYLHGPEAHSEHLHQSRETGSCLTYNEWCALQEAKKQTRYQTASYPSQIATVHLTS